MNIILRYKERLVAQGFFQVFGVDYTDTYSPVAKFVSIRIFLAISVQHELIIHAMDVDTAFLNADIDEDIWVEISEGTKLAMMMESICLGNPYMDLSKLPDIGTMALIRISLTMTSRIRS